MSLVAVWRIDSHGGEDWKPGDYIGSYCNSETCFEGIDDKSLLMNWIPEVRKRGNEDDTQLFGLSM